MKITLIAPTPPDVAAFGVRTLSSYLKRHGKDVHLVFLPGGVEKYKHTAGYRYEYEHALLGQVVDLCRGSSLVGISFMSNYLHRAEQIARAVKKAVDVPVIVGGIHPTVMPEQCLDFADIVCVGEGEEALLELVQRMEAGKDLTDIRNLYFKRGKDIIRNPLRPLIQDLDSLPFVDFSMDGQFIYDIFNKQVVPMNKDLLMRSFPLEPHQEGSFNDSYTRTRSYKTMTTRGCPHNCTYCAEKTLADLYTGQRYLRKRSVPHIMAELQQVSKELSFVESIFLFDDTFLARTNDEIKEFATAYKKTIGLPFHIQASPTTVTVEKMEALIDAGLAFVEMGIQSMSATAKDLYKRTVPEATILKAANLFHAYRKQIYPPCYHVILDNPWETPQDVVETLNLVLKLPSPFWLKRASLVCFPGTELYIKAKQDGLIKSEEDELREIYSKHLHTPKGTYVNILMYLAGFSYFPRWILRVLSSKLFVAVFERKMFSKVYTFLYRVGEALIILAKGIRALFKGDFSRLYRYFVKVTSKTA